MVSHMGNYPAAFAAMFGRADLLQTILGSPGDCVDLGVEVKEDDLAWLAVKYPGGEAEVIIEVCQTALRGGEGGLEHQGHCRQHSPAVLPQAEHTGKSPASLLSPSGFWSGPSRRGQRRQVPGDDRQVSVSLLLLLLSVMC